MAEQTRGFIENYATLHYEFDSRIFDMAETLRERCLNYFDSIRMDVYDSVYLKMRDDRGGERENLKVLTIGGDSPSLVAFGDLVQTWVDEFGLEPGTFPPFGPESLLYFWAAKHLDVTVPETAGKGGQSIEDLQDKQIQSVAFLVARAIYTRGLPAPSDYLHRPFGNTFDEFLPRVMLGLSEIAGEVALTFAEGVA